MHRKNSSLKLSFLLGLSVVFAVAFTAKSLLPTIGAEDKHDHEKHDKGKGHDEHEGHGHDKPKGKGHDQHDEHEGHVEGEEEEAVKFTKEEFLRAGLRTDFVEIRILEDELPLTGEVLVNEERLVHLSPRAGGVVVEVTKQLGDGVKKGDVLAIIDSAEVGETALGCLAAHNGFELAKADLDRTTLIVMNTRKMLEILDGETSPEKVAAELKDLKIGQAKADLLEAMSEIEVALPSYEKQKKLFEWQKNIYDATVTMLRALDGVKTSADAAMKLETLRVGVAKADVLKALTQRELAQVALLKTEKLFSFREPIYKNTLNLLEIFRSGLSAAEALEKVKGLNVGKAKKDLIEALASVELARANFKRQQQLLNENVGSLRAMQEAQKDLDTSSSAYESLVEQIRLSAEQDYLEAQQEFMAAKQEAVSAVTTYPALLEQIGVSAESDYLEQEKELLKSLGVWIKARSSYAAKLEQVAFDADIALLSAEKAFKMAGHQVRSANDRLGVLGLSLEHIKQLEMNGVERITYLPITAPMDGRILDLHIVKGEKVESGDEHPLFTIGDLSDVWVNFDIYENDLAKIKAGVEVHVEVRAYPAQRFDGQLSFVGDVLRKASRSVKGRAVVKNNDYRLKPGMFARVRVPVGDKEEVVAIPTSALQTLHNKTVVFVQENEDEMRFAPKQVKVGRTMGGYAEILDGIFPGDTVVTEGGFIVKSEMMKEAMGHGHSH